MHKSYRICAIRAHILAPINSKRTATRVLRHSTRSFGNKPLAALDWSSKSRKRHRHLLKCDQGKRIRGKIFSWKEYYFFWDCTHNIFNFNKYFVRIIFLFCFANFAGPKMYKICTYKVLLTKFLSMFWKPNQIGRSNRFNSRPMHFRSDLPYWTV